MRAIRDTTGRIYAIQLWRLVLYVDSGHPALRHGGIMINHRDQRLHARHLGWRVCFAT